MTDIAGLGFSIDTSELGKATKDLDALDAAGKKSEDSAKRVGQSWREAAGQMAGDTSEIVRQLRELNKTQGSTLQALAKLNGTVDKYGNSAAKMAAQTRSSAGAAEVLAKAQRESASAAKVGQEAVRDQQTALSRLLSQIDPVTAALKRMEAQERELAGFKASGLIDASTFDNYQAKINAYRASLEKARGTIEKTGISSKQTAFALRQLPAQFSDIFISLQGGQNPLTVLLQQGSQIKDSFGGVGPALRETAKYATKLINPFTILVATGIALAVAYKQGSDEADAYNKAIITTGNYAGVTAGKLNDMAASISKTVGTQHEAADVLAKLTSTGRFASDQLQSLAAAAVKLERSTGQSIDDTVSLFVRLSDAPVSAVEQLNKSQHFLTLSVYEQIKALQEQGKATDAARVALNALSSATDERTRSITENLGSIERGWINVKDAISDAWDAVRSIGRDSSLEELKAKLDQLQKSLAGNGLNGTQRAIASSQLAAIQQKIAQEEARQQAASDKSAALIAQEQAISAVSRLDEIGKAAQSMGEKRKKALEQLAKDIEAIRAANPKDPNLDPANIAKLQAAINEKYKDPKPQEERQTSAARLLKSLDEQQAVLQEQDRLGRKLSAEEAKRSNVMQQIVEAEALKAKKGQEGLSVDQKSLIANKEKIKAYLDQNVALAKKIQLQIKAAEEAKKLAAFQESLAAQNRQSAAAYALQLSGAGLGDKEAERLKERIQLQQEYLADKTKLNEQFNSGQITESLYQSETAALKDSYAEKLKLQQDFFAQSDKNQQNWLNGATSALQNYADNTNNVAQQAKDLVGGTLETLTKGIGDSFAKSIVYGDSASAAMKELARTVLTDVVSSFVQLAARLTLNGAIELSTVQAVADAKVASAAQVAAAQVAAIGTTTTASVAATETVAAAQAPAAAATTAAWTPAATAASIGSFGSAAAIGLAAVVAAIALARNGFRDGGYTGNLSSSDIAGVVHGREYVFDAQATQRIGVANLERLRAGRDIAINASQRAKQNGYQTPAIAQPRPTVINQNIQVSGRVDNRTSSQIARETARKQRMATRLS